MIPNGDPRDGFFYLILTPMMNSYNLTHVLLHVRRLPRECIGTRAHGRQVTLLLHVYVKVTTSCHAASHRV